ncbi:efflux RND transporter periplasmic adaptor subunit [Paenibacillus sp. PK4536]|uniref:Suppressor protein SRP40 n=1 Tax=Paenibacillus nuruki TaxID=1886670 RepID=A0A1E3L600_9BACL|nr:MULTISPECIES: efflux RND transporter periplasmic adaptor subunit [Paenibacillus]ODP28400.1 Suppressor protein SRP40 [Paenibacillus nuruki]WIM38207.1 efflux RND transporter periplasmic adaptor subunit [Paenibacillus sp. PK4536]
MNSKKRIWITLAIIIVLAASAVTGYVLWPKSQEEIVVEPTPSIPVQKGEITVLIKGAGSIKPTSQTVVYADHEGNINQVNAKINTRVQKGQVLFTYKNKDNAKDITQQTNTLKQQQSDLQDKQEQYKQLVMNNATPTELDSARLGIEKGKDDITVTETEIARLQKDQAAPAPLLSPISGTITKMSVSPGGAVSSGAEAFTIIDYQDLSATIQVDELDVLKIHQGLKATLQLDAIPDQTYHGKVSMIANEGAIKNGVSTFGVTIHLDQPGEIKAGMSAQATILVEQKKNILVLPIESVIQQGNQYVVQKARVSAGTQNAQPDTTTEQKVSIGIHDDSQIEIKSGLKEGDLVVIPSSDMSGLSTSSSASTMSNMGGSDDSSSTPTSDSSSTDSSSTDSSSNTSTDSSNTTTDNSSDSSSTGGGTP